MDNNLKECLEILNSIWANPSRTTKETILQNNKENELLKDILYFIYNPYIVTGISTKKLNKKVNLKANKELNTITDIMEFLKTNNTGTDQYIKTIQNWIEKQDAKYQKILKQIVTKSLKVGVTAKTINKIHKYFIPEFNVMLAEKYHENIDKVKGKFIITTKLDGNRMVLIKENGVVKLFSRQGQLIEGLIDIIKDAENLKDNMVYDGEALLKNDKNLDSKQLFQETQKIIRKKGVTKTNLIFNIFDMMSLDEFKQGKSINDTLTRKNQLHALLDSLKLDWIKEVPILYAGTNKNRIDELLNEAIKNGEEGIMINLANAKYQCKRTKNLLKVKKFNDCDVKVVDIIEGTGKNARKLGAITVQFKLEEKLYQTNVGSGFSDNERIKYFNNPYLLIGKIVTIGYFEITKNKKNEYGMRFPTWKGIIRDDKDEISMY